MKVDRAEWTGTGAAILFHAALIAAMSMSLAHVAKVPEPPAMEVDFVTEEIAMEAAAPTSIASPPPAAQSPTVEPVPEPPAPPPPPPVPQPRAVPKPVVRPAPKPTYRPASPVPSRPARPAPAKSRLGDDFLKGIDDDLAPRAGAARPSAPTFNAAAKASVGSAILRQVQPCANRQPFIGEGANTLRLTVNLKLARSGRLSRPPTILGIAGDGDLKSKYGDLLEDQVRRIFTQCSPLRLPADLYDTANGGWSDFTFTYRVK